MIHMYIGAEITRNTKTACKVALESLPRQHESVPYRHRDKITCCACLAVANRISTMRQE